VKKVVIIDFDMGNLFSVQQACTYSGLTPNITADPKEIIEADAVILPGVGAFGEAMTQLNKMQLVDPIQSFIQKGNPFMGICLGLQLLFSGTEEFGQHEGLNIIPGTVLKFPTSTSKNSKRKVPQVGWNRIYPGSKKNEWQKSPLENIAFGEFMYFVHSYYTTPHNENDMLTTTNYEGLDYCSSIIKENVFATQFHPEKSGLEGLKIYKNWALQI
jgi:imidazole glycerol-phosphate synthase subunit HisH